MKELVPVCAHDHGCASPGKRPHTLDWQTVTFAPGDFEAGGNIGLRTRYFPAIDVDAEDPSVVAAVEDIAREIFGTTARRTRANSARCALLYRLDGEPFKKTRILFDEPAGSAAKIEVLGDGQQLVVEGTHASGAELEWTGSPSDGGALAPMSVATRDDFLSAIRGALEAAGCRNVEVDHEEPRNGQKAVGKIGEQAAVAGATAEPSDEQRARKYADAAIAKARRAIEGKPKGERNDELNRRAFSLGKLVAGRVASRPIVEAELTAAALHVGLTAAETRASIRSGLDAGAREPRGLPLQADEQEERTTDEQPTNTAALAAPDVRQITLARARNPPIERFLVGALFPFGKPSVLYGPTGAGKSAFLQGLAFKTAAGGGGSFLGMLMHDQEGAPVLIYTAEDTFEDWERKAATILHGCPDIDIERALSRLHIIDKSEGEGRLTEIVQLRTDLGGESVMRSERRPTPERLALIDTAKRLGARMIAIETASHLVDKEANEDFAALLAACGHVGAETGAAVILSHHPTKSAAENNDSSPEGARGGGAFINNARTAVSLFPAGEAVVTSLQARGLSFAAGDTLLLEHQKGTSSVPKQGPIVLVRCPTPYGAVLQTPELASANPERAREMAIRADRQARDLAEQFRRLVDLVADMRQAGPVSPRKIRDVDGIAAKLGVPVRRVEGLIGEAITAGHLVALKRDCNDRILALDVGSPPATLQRAMACDPRLIDD